MIGLIPLALGWSRSHQQRNWPPEYLIVASGALATKQARMIVDDSLPPASMGRTRPSRVKHAFFHSCEFEIKAGSSCRIGNERDIRGLSAREFARLCHCFDTYSEVRCSIQKVIPDSSEQWFQSIVIHRLCSSFYSQTDSKVHLTHENQFGLIGPRGKMPIQIEIHRDAAAPWKVSAYRSSLATGIAGIRGALLVRMPDSGPLCFPLFIPCYSECV
jgi:hypothetical protein